MGHNQNPGAKLMGYNVESMDSNSFFADLSLQPWRREEIFPMEVNEWGNRAFYFIPCNSYYL